MKTGESDIINNAAVCKLGILQFVRIIRLNWIGHVNRMDSKRKGSQVFNNNPQRSRLRGRPKNRAAWEKPIKEAKVRIGLW